MLGLFVSDHPLLGVEALLARMCDCSITSLESRAPGDVLTVGGMVSGLRKKVTKNGGVMILADLEDISGASVEVIVFPTAQEKFGHLVKPDAILLVRGRLDRDARDDSVKVIAMEVNEPQLGEDRPVRITVTAASCTNDVVDRLKEVLSNHPGKSQVFLELTVPEGAPKTFRLPREFCVDQTNGLHAEVKALLGPNALASL